MGRIPGVRRAVAASVAAHAILVAVLVVVLRPGNPPPQRIDTRAGVVSLRIPDDDAPVVAPPEPAPVRAGGGRESADPRVESAGSRPPLAFAAPQTLPAELIARIRRPTGANPAHNPNVTPAAGTAARPIHGAMRPGQTVVYALDCSGSMGEFGKFDAARAALAATLRAQPGSVRFQVVVYSGSTRLLIPGGCVPATPANIAAAEARLAALAPSGRSDHAAAARAAAGLRPDVILFLTDADDLSARILNPALVGGGKAVPACVARVGPDRVADPVELR